MSESPAKTHINKSLSQPLLSSASCHIIRKLTTKMFQSLLSCKDMEEIANRALTIQRDIDEICVKSAATTSISNLKSDEDNHDNDDENLGKATKISVSMAHHGKYHAKSELLMKLREMKEKITHEKILLLSIGEYVKRGNFFPPYISDLIAMTERIARISHEDLLCDFNIPFVLEHIWNLIKNLEQAYAVISEHERKIIFILTLLRMLKNLGDSIFTCTHPRNQKSELRLSFKVPSLFFAIPYYRFIFDWFDFDDDSILMQLLFVKFMEIKIANETAKWSKFMKPMNFKNAVVLYGSKNLFKNGLKPPQVICTFNMRSSCEMIEGVKEFMKTGEFEWKNAAKKIEANFEFSCQRNSVENCRSTFFMNINYDENQAEKLS